jgi:hypothetical protein
MPDDFSFSFATDTGTSAASGFSFDFVSQPDSLESDVMPPNNLKHVREAKLETVKAMKRQWCFEHIAQLPAPGVSVHLVTNARFDFWDFVPTLLKMAAPAVAEEFYASTWILNRRNAVELLQLYDEGKLKQIGFLTGIYFKRRESATFATLYEGLATRGQRFRACLNHSKFFTMLLTDGTALTCESSANFTENGNIETHVLTHDRGLFEFHKSWVNEILDAK